MRGAGVIAKAEGKREGCRFITALSIIVLPETFQPGNMRRLKEGMGALEAKETCLQPS